MIQRGIRKTKVGQVVSDKMDKTIVVQVISKVKHPKYGKYYNKRSKFYAHNEKFETRIGDLVRITEVRPVSKLKRWKVVEVLKKGMISEVQAATDSAG